jgi:uncharacterized protein YjbI with pentapeptide repeats
MAETSHLEKLKLGLNAWTEWRKRNPSIAPDLSGSDLSNLDLRSFDLSHANLEGALLRGANLSKADLTAANLQNAHVQDSITIIQGPEAKLSSSLFKDRKPISVSLRGAQFKYANFKYAILEHADLSETYSHEADFSEASLFQATLSGSYHWKADFTGANLQYANLDNCVLPNSKMIGAYLDDASLVNATIWCDLTKARLRGTNFENTDVTYIKYDRKTTKFKGCRVDSCYGNALFRRDAQDQDWVETFRQESKLHSVLYHIWNLTSDCGRSFLRPLLMSAVVIIAFGLLYTIFPIVKTEPGNSRLFRQFAPHYSSLMTFVSFGLGDISPVGIKGRIAVGSEIVLGYISTGLLISILANKVGRRS